MNWDTTWICTCGDWYTGDGIMELIQLTELDDHGPLESECHRWDCGWAREWGVWGE